MKKVFFVLAGFALLTSCGSSSSTTLNTSSSVINPTSVSTESSLSSSLPLKTLLDFTFEGYEDDESAIDFFAKGWSTSESKFTATNLKLLRKNGFVRTPDLPEHSGHLQISLTTHITGLDRIDDTAVGKYIEFKVEGLKSVGEYDYEVVDFQTYKHVVTEADVLAHSFPDFPAYSSDFSSEPYIVTLTGTEIVRVRITLVNKIIYGTEQDGCNLDIRRMVVSDLL